MSDATVEAIKAREERTRRANDGVIEEPEPARRRRKKADEPAETDLSRLAWPREAEGD